jgi:hypothetical protein
VFRKRRRPTPGFKIPPPFNPVSGDFADLSPKGVTPYCALMQVAADDTYADYVICRGFDTRIGRFVDYEENNPTLTGISVAKPYGNREPQTYKVGEIYPAFLPIQGTSTYIPPSPSSVNFRLGQNPGVVTVAAEPDGHPSGLSSYIDLLIDHNGRLVNWLLIDTAAQEEESCDDLAPGSYRGIAGAEISPGETGPVIYEGEVYNAINQSKCPVVVGDKAWLCVSPNCELFFTPCVCECESTPPEDCCDKHIVVCIGGFVQVVQLVACANDLSCGPAWQPYTFPLFVPPGSFMDARDSGCCQELRQFIFDNSTHPFPYYEPLFAMLYVCCEANVISAWVGLRSGIPGGICYEQLEGPFNWTALCSPTGTVTNNINIDAPATPSGDPPPCLFVITAANTIEDLPSCEGCDGVPAPEDCCDQSLYFCLNGVSQLLAVDGGTYTWDISDCCDCAEATFQITLSCRSSPNNISLGYNLTCDGNVESGVENTIMSQFCEDGAPRVIKFFLSCFVQLLISQVQFECDECEDGDPPPPEDCCDETRWFCINGISKQMTLSGDTETFDVKDCCDCETSVLTLSVECIGETSTMRIDWSITCGGFEPASGFDVVACDTSVFNIVVNQCFYQVQISETNIGCAECEGSGSTTTAPPPPGT